jgi:hypothetical protein
MQTNSATEFPVFSRMFDRPLLANPDIVGGAGWAACDPQQAFDGRERRSRNYRQSRHR